MQKLLMLGSLLLMTACGGGTVDAQGDPSAKQHVAPAAAAADKVAGEKVGGCCSDKADACCSEGKAAPAAACCADEKAAAPAAGAAKKEGCEASGAGCCGACPPESKPTPVAPQ
ncbi:MAG: hypothetical protein U1F60_02585 [Planctomycetota bacterium]